MRRISRLVALMVVASLVFLVPGCNSDVAAKVNGVIIKKSLVDSQTKQYMDAVEKQNKAMGGKTAAPSEKEIRQRVLDNLINTELIRQAADQRGIKVTDKDVAEQIAGIKKNFPDQKAFDAALKQAGMTMDQLNEQIRDQIIITKLKEELNKKIDIADKEITDYYNANKAQFKEAAAVRAAHILVSDKATAERIMKDIKAGADFAGLAKQYSKDPVSAAKGGDLGWPTSPYVPEFQAAADKLKKKGDISPIIKTTYGFHIIKLIDRRTDRQKPLAEVKEQIRQMLQAQKSQTAFTKLIEDLKKKADIEMPK